MRVHGAADQEIAADLAAGGIAERLIDTQLVQTCPALQVEVVQQIDDHVAGGRHHVGIPAHGIAVDRDRTFNRETGNRVESQYVDAETGKPVAEDDQAKDYEIEDDRSVILEDEKLEAVGLESTRTIDIERFVPREDVSWIWLDRPHLLKPGDKVGEEAFGDREAMRRPGRRRCRGWCSTGVSTR
jgi:hypothetical protein